jgi:glycosyltransferase involved in cell wall biosynthesis
MDSVAAAIDRPIGVLVKVFPKLSETFILEEVLGLERLGLALRLYTLAAPSDGVAHSDAARVRARVRQVPESVRDDAIVFARRHLRLLIAAPLRYLGQLASALLRGGEGMSDFARAGWLAGQLRDDGVAHLHAHFISRPADLAERVSLLSGLPYSISAHAKDIYLSQPAQLRRKLASARFTLTCTDFNCRTLIGIAPDARVHRMYHGIDRSVFNPLRRTGPAGLPLILSVGRLRAKKGLDTLIEACALLRRRGRSFRCEIVGYGEEQASLAAQIERHALHSSVSLAGKLTRDQVVERYARAAVYVQASRVAADGDRDGIPNVLLEAMAMGLPVVATRVSGIPELVAHRSNGLLVPADSPAALADAVAELLDDPLLGQALGRAACATVSRHFDNDTNLRLLCHMLAVEPETSHESPSRRFAWTWPPQGGLCDERLSAPVGGLYRA